MSNQDNKEFLEQVESVMKEPSPIEITDYEEKIRRNLIVASGLTLIVIKLGLIPNEDSRFFGGMQFDNLTPEVIYTILLSIVIYEFFHYSWLLANKFMYWRVRLTGTKHNEFRGNRGSIGSSYEQLDFTGKQENSNLYVWMLESKDKTIISVDTVTKNWLDVEQLCQDMKVEISNHDKSNDLLKKLNEIDTNMKSLQLHLENIRISASLHRFDSWFHCLVRSQSWRWLFLDALFPMLMGITSIWLLVYKLF